MYLLFVTFSMLSSPSSVIFFHRSVGEFWYNLSLSAEAPTATSLYTMECELGRWVQQTITLNNPTGMITENYLVVNFRLLPLILFLKAVNI